MCACCAHFPLSCRPIGEKIAESLPAFSLDLVGLVCTYSVCAAVSKDAKPIFLFKIDSTPDISKFDEVDAVAVDGDDRLWVLRHDGAHIFTTEGAYIGEAHAPDAQRSVAVACTMERGPSGLAFIADWVLHEIQVFQRDGTFVRRLSPAKSDTIKLASLRNAPPMPFNSDGSNSQLIQPFALCSDDAEELLYVLYRMNNVLVLRRDGSIVRGFGVETRQAADIHLCQGLLFIGDQTNEAIQVS